MLFRHEGGMVMANRYGTLGADSLTGTNVDDYISGGPLGNEAADTGNDTLLGGAGGFDVIYGWGGADSIVGSADSAYDYLYGGDGNDTISVGYGQASGEAGNDSIVGVASDYYSYMFGGAGADTLIGSTSRDYLYDSDESNTANTDADSLSGGGGSDYLYSYGGADTLDGGADNDFAIIDRSGLVVGLRFTPTAAGTAYVGSDGTRVVNIENFEVYGGSGNDTLSGLGNGDQLYGNGGNDSITANGFGYVDGGTGNDTISAGAGSANGGDGDDRITVNASSGSGFASGGIGNDTLIATSADGTGSQLAGGLGADSLIGSAVSDDLSDNSGYNSGNDAASDTLSGGDGDDVLTSTGGADRLDGGIGFDTAILNRTFLTVNFSLTVGLPTATSTASDGTTLTGIESVQIVSGSGKDKLIANAGDDYLYGNAGNDLLNGGKGNDQLDGGINADTLIGGAGNDGLSGGANADAFRWVAFDKKVDRVIDFDQGLDRLEFSSNAVGGLLPLGALNAANFTLGTAATGAVPQFFYNTTTDTLFWDADGSGAIKSAIIATFGSTPSLILNAADIVIIA